MKLPVRAAAVAVRATLLLGVLVVLTGVAGRLALQALQAPRAAVAATGLSGLTTLPFAQALTGLCAVAVLACWLWLAASTAAAAVGTAMAALRAGRPAGTPTRTPARAAAPPRAVRRFVAVCLGVTVCATAPVPAHATTVDHSTSGGAGPARSAGLTGLALPDRVASPPAADRERPVVMARPETVTVRPGQSLWSIAASLAPHGAGTAEVAAACRHLWRLNEDVLGPDPDLIFPGTRLVVPRHDHLRKDTP